MLAKFSDSFKGLCAFPAVVCGFFLVLGHVGLHLASEGKLFITVLAGESSFVFVHVPVERIRRGTQLFANGTLYGWMFLLVVVVKFGLGVVGFITVSAVVCPIAGT